MTTQEAIRELQNIRQYCAAKSIPAVDFALKVLREKLEQEENSKKTGKSPGIRKCGCRGFSLEGNKMAGKELGHAARWDWPGESCFMINRKASMSTMPTGRAMKGVCTKPATI